jgi:hypothetical protein
MKVEGTAAGVQSTTSSPWGSLQMCLERCGDDAADIASQFFQLAVNRSAFTGVAFELFK